MYNMYSQTIAERIKTILDKHNISARKMLEDCDLNKNALFTMQSGNLPRIDTIIQIANYLDCSVDYLLGRETQETSTHLLDTDSQDLLEMFNALDAESQKQVLNYINSLYYIVKVNSNIK